MENENLNNTQQQDPAVQPTQSFAPQNNAAQTPAAPQKNEVPTVPSSFYFPSKLGLGLFLLAFPVTFWGLWKYFFAPTQRLHSYIFIVYFAFCAMLLAVFSGKIMRMFVLGTFFLVLLGFLFGETILYALSLVPMFFIVLSAIKNHYKK